MIEIAFPCNPAWWGFDDRVVAETLREFQHWLKWNGHPGAVTFVDVRRRRVTIGARIVTDGATHEDGALHDAQKWYKSQVERLRARMAELAADHRHEVTRYPLQPFPPPVAA